MQVKEFLQQQGYRGNVLQIEGSNFQAAEWKQSVAQMATYLWLGGLGLQFFGDALFANLGVTEKPAFYVYLKENPMQVRVSMNIYILCAVCCVSLCLSAHVYITFTNLLHPHPHPHPCRYWADCSL